KQSIDRLVEKSAGAGFNNLFVQVCGRADSYFPSRVYPPAESYASRVGDEFDPLAYLLRKAHLKGLKVHAWINTLLVWSAPKKPKDPYHVVNAYPDWMMVDRDGVSLGRYSRAKFNGKRITGVFISPAEPGFRRMIERYVLDLVDRYRVDGVHFDYLRYPMRDVDFSPRACAGFKAAQGVDPRDLFAKGSGRLKLSSGELARLKEKWTEYRAGVVTGFVRELCTRLEKKNPALVRSVAVKPRLAPAYEVFGQDWPRWVREGLIDMVLPMAYSTDPAAVYSQISAACEAVGPDHVWAGLRAYSVPVAGTIARAEKLGPLGLGGICFFSYNGVEDNPAFFERVSSRLFR
ncbi:MAG: family 10 glycosylhydrolase, partial [Gemmatimonadota bacterium]|nr:family 10 glycosylhydrolase [Gemmatimonadota bacterium]